MHLIQGLSLKKIIFILIIAIMAVLSLFFLIFKVFPKKTNGEISINDKEKEVEESESKIEDLDEIEKDKIEEINNSDVSVGEALKYLEGLLKWIWLKDCLEKIIKQI